MGVGGNRFDEAVRQGLTVVRFSDGERGWACRTPNGWVRLSGMTAANGTYEVRMELDYRDVDKIAYSVKNGGIDPKAHKLGAAVLVMAIVGGALLTSWMAAIIDAPGFWAKLVPMFDAAVDPVLHASSVSLRASFFVPVICFAVVGLYAVVFSGKKGK